MLSGWPHLRRVTRHAEDAHLLELGAISREKPSTQQMHHRGYTTAAVGPLDLVRGRVGVRVRIRVGVGVGLGVGLRVRG